MGKSAKAPPPTDYKAAAEADRYNQYTPLGTAKWSTEGGVPATEGHWGERTIQTPGGLQGNGSWQPGQSQVEKYWIPGTPAQGGKTVQTFELDPRLQSGLDAQLGKIQSQGVFDLNGVNDIYNKAYSAMTARLDPQWTSREDAERTRLANQGLSYGSEAYSGAMKDFNQARNDAYQQATLGAIQTMPQTYQLAEAAYNQPLNWINALGGGTQISPGGGGIGGNGLQAAMAQGQDAMGRYNAQQGANNAMTSGLFGLGAAAIPLMFAASDRRVKEDITRVGKTDGGLPVYTYRYKGSPQTQMGVMAQDVEQVRPDAVAEFGGIKAVDYSKVQ